MSDINNQANQKHFVAKLAFNDNSKIHGFEYRCMSVMIPSFEFDVIDTKKNGNIFKRSSGALTHATVSIEIILDEDLLIYEELHELANNYKDFERFGDTLQVLVYNNQHKHILTMEFEDILLSSIDGISYDLRNLGEVEMTTSLEIEFSDFKIKRIKNGK